MSRNYKKEYENYQGTPTQKKNRAARGRARYALMKAGRVRIGDSLDVAHKNDNPNDNDPSNLKVQSKSKNRSFSRTKDARMKNRGKGLGHE